MGIYRVLVLLAFAYSAHALEISAHPKRVAQGQVSVVRIRARDPEASAISLSHNSKEIPLLYCNDGKVPVLCGFVPFALTTTPGDQEVSVGWEDNGARRSKHLSLLVKKGPYQTSKLKVNPELVSLSDEEKKRIATEREESRAAYARSNDEPLWTGPFQLPTKGAITSKFGNRRIFNGELKSVHAGVDLRASTKTPILAANAGRVVLSKSMFYAGNQVIVDHGAGIFSSYGHLSTMLVKPGEMVTKGQQLGLAGATGRVTGPHLHWAMKVHGISVDPMQLKQVFNRFESKVTHDQLPSLSKSSAN